MKTGRCRVCGQRDLPLRKDGTVRPHKKLVFAYGTSEAFQKVPCDGAGKYPKEEA